MEPSWSSGMADVTADKFILYLGEQFQASMRLKAEAECCCLEYYLLFSLYLFSMLASYVPLESYVNTDLLSLTCVWQGISPETAA